MKRTQKILILGGGFAGVEVERELEKLLTPDEAALQLVSRDNFVLFTPMLHEVAASDVDISAIANPIRKMLRRTEFIVADVENIDTSTTIMGAPSRLPFFISPTASSRLCRRLNT